MSVLSVRRATLDDPLVAPMLAELNEDYRTRYGPGVAREMNRYPAAEFAPPGGALLLLVEAGMAVAGGAFRRYDDDTTAELKRVWTHSAHRRRGLGRRILAELEAEARHRGYRRLFLHTGPRQPEAVALYLAAGYAPLYDLALPAEQVGAHPFEKLLTPP